ncbi:MAG: large repetitive protein [Chthoniobacter sp.]|nr:large repetitive protein [Chthoniobacter sp.]
MEQRIAPAILTGFTQASHGSAIPLDADPSTPYARGLSTSTNGGSYLLYVEKGSALVYTTDLNNNGQVDFNEITGIAAGDGLRLISFVDIHGDIVTNLNPDFTLTDSDNDASNGRDGRVLLNNTIEKITLRSVTQADVAPTTNPSDRLALSSYSIFGNIYAGKGFGALDGGLIVDDSGGSTLQVPKFDGLLSTNLYVPSHATIGSIDVGTAASGQLFSFGTAAPGLGLGVVPNPAPGAPDRFNVHGQMEPFTPPAGQAGADIITVKSATASGFDLGTLHAGDGGMGARGGNVVNVNLKGDNAGGYRIIAGNGALGATGGQGGSIMNFADAGSITSAVILRSGDGGEGLIGAGGNAGSIQFDQTAPQNLNARFITILGNGGAGFTNGGAGGSQTTATITVPEGAVSPFTLGLSSTTHTNGEIYVEQAGSHELRGFDFDHDGFNDLVYSTAQPDQLVVLFGLPDGTFDTRSALYLNSPVKAQAFIIADLNGDGNEDVAATSSTDSNAGVSVFLSQYDPVTGAFQGFRDTIYSPYPSLTPPAYPFLQKAVPTLSLSAGDFDGDGATDLAVVTTQTDLLLKKSDVLLILRNDSATEPGGSAHFYADFTIGDPSLLFNGAGVATSLRATSVSDKGVGMQPLADALLVGRNGAKVITEIDYSSGTIFTNTISLGQVDTDRNLSTVGKKDHVGLQDATLQDFTVIDMNNDGLADIVALSKNPTGYLVTFQGALVGGNATALSSYDFNPASSPNVPNTINPGVNADGDNNGIKISGSDGLGLSDTLVGILPTNADNDGGMSRVNDVAVIDYAGLPKPVINEIAFAAVVPNDNSQASVAGAYGILLAPGDKSILAYDSYLPDPTAPQFIQYDFGYPVKNDPLNDLIEADGDLNALLRFGIPDFYDLQHQGIFFTGGNGGEGLIGKGGNGGVIGNTLTQTNGVIASSINVTLPKNQAYEGTVRFVGGDGGKGFREGGDGGKVSGVFVTYKAGTTLFTSNVLLIAGDGGESVTKTGGKGGNLQAFSVATGEVFVAGNGGDGVIGGVGGSVVGNAIPGLTDVNGNFTAGSNVEDVLIVAAGGNGGNGIKRGGDAGGVSKFSARILSAGGLEAVQYIGGIGGNAVSGPGGRGGSVVDSSPVLDANNLVGDILLRGGAGGRGTTGGAGGTVQNFVNTPGTGGNPTSLAAFGGNGGLGTAGNGGAGGGITNVQATVGGAGFEYDFDFSDPQILESFFDAVVLVNPSAFSRMIAGNGGKGFGGKGGDGGTITGSTAGATSSSFMVAAGAGGDGLRSGGDGGDVSSSAFDSAGGTSKLLIIAGQGGDAYSGNVSAAKPLRYGGVAGAGGQGGDITGINQLSGTTVHVDLIAGNGGNTINDGSSQSVTSNVGNGGSIKNSFFAGNIGNVDATTAIRAYNDINFGQQVADFVATQVAAPLFNLDDTFGNVGIVVGAKGRVQDENHDGILDPSTGGTNGSVSDLTAAQLMSAVAGSVDRIASIASLTNVKVTAQGAVFGADKLVDSGDLTLPRAVRPDRTMSGDGVPYSTALDYLTPADTHTPTPVGGGRLVDGAIIAANVRPLKSTRDFRKNL